MTVRELYKSCTLGELEAEIQGLRQAIEAIEKDEFGIWRQRKQEALEYYRYRLAEAYDIISEVEDKVRDVDAEWRANGYVKGEDGKWTRKETPRYVKKDGSWILA